MFSSSIQRPAKYGYFGRGMFCGGFCTCCALHITLHRQSVIITPRGHQTLIHGNILVQNCIHLRTKLQIPQIKFTMVSISHTAVEQECTTSLWIANRLYWRKTLRRAENFVVIRSIPHLYAVISCITSDCASIKTCTGGEWFDGCFVGFSQLKYICTGRGTWWQSKPGQF